MCFKTFQVPRNHIDTVRWCG